MPQISHSNSVYTRVAEDYEHFDGTNNPISEFNQYHNPISNKHLSDTCEKENARNR